MQSPTYRPQQKVRKIILHANDKNHNKKKPGPPVQEKKWNVNILDFETIDQ